MLLEKDLWKTTRRAVAGNIDELPDKKKDEAIEVRRAITSK